MQNEKLQSLRKHLSYSPETGELFVLRDGKRIRKLIPNYEQVLQSTIEGIKVKIKFNKLIYFVHTGVEVQDPYIVFHKDLNDSNFQFRNLMLITKQEHFAILESLKNLQGTMKLVPHPTDVFSYVLEYKKDGRTKKEVISDITVARKRLRKLQLQCAKYVGKYVVSI